MALTDHAILTPRNRLLAALPPDDLARLWPQLEAVPLPLRKVLSTPGKPITAVHFVETGYVSMLAYLGEGDLIEVGVVGNEGIIGLPVLLGECTLMSMLRASRSLDATIEPKVSGPRC